MESAIALGFLLLGGAAATPWSVDIVPNIILNMNNMVSVPFSLKGENLPLESRLKSTSNDDIARTNIHSQNQTDTSISGILNITGVFIGRTKLTFVLEENGVSDKEKDQKRSNFLKGMTEISLFIFFFRPS